MIYGSARGWTGWIPISAARPRPDCAPSLPRRSRELFAFLGWIALELERCTPQHHDHHFEYARVIGRRHGILKLKRAASHPSRRCADKHIRLSRSPAPTGTRLRPTPFRGEKGHAPKRLRPRSSALAETANSPIPNPPIPDPPIRQSNEQQLSPCVLPAKLIANNIAVGTQRMMGNGLDAKIG